MSIRKGLTLLLLAAFGLSTIAPALAINVNNGITFQTLAQDEGSSTNGAKPDVVATDIIFELNNAGDLFLATDGTDIAANHSANFSTAGVINLVGGSTVPAPAVTIFNPPTGCAFVKLPGYTEVTTTSAIDLDDTLALQDTFVNVSVLNTGNLPQAASQANYIVAQVLDAQPSAISNDATLPTSGLLAIHAFTSVDSATQNSALVRVTTQNIGLACDASSSALTTGDISATVVQPNIGSYVQALPNLTTGSTIKIAEYGDNVGKLEAIIAGDVTGNTGGVSEDTQPSTLISNTALNSVTSVNFGPSDVTNNSPSGATTDLDVDAILIRAAEQPNSTNSAPLFYQTPFATARFRANSGTAITETAGAATLNNAVLTTDGTLFGNTSNALITVELELQNNAGGTSDATLQVDRAYVGLHGNQVDTMIRPLDTATGTIDNAFTASADNAAIDPLTRGFLGAVANVADRGVISSYTFAGTADDNGTYNGAATTGGAGTGATFNVVVAGGAVTSVAIADGGTGYAASNTVTIPGTNLGGTSPADDLTVTVTAVTSGTNAFDQDDAGIVVMGDGAAGDNALTVKDGSMLDFTVLNVDAGLNETALATPAVDGAPAAAVINLDDGSGATAAEFDDLFIFPGSVLRERNTPGNVGLVASHTFASTGTEHPVTLDTAITGVADGDVIVNVKEVYAGLVGGTTPPDDTFYFTVNGTLDGGDIIGASDRIEFGATNFADSSTAYNASPTVKTTNTGVNQASNNVLMATKLTKSGSNYLIHILPFVNKFDGIRDVISVRPKGTITFGSNTLTEGVKLVAKVSGNNLDGTTELTLANVLPANSVSSNATARILPVSGDMDQLLREDSTDPTVNRAEFNPGTLLGTTTLNDSFEDLIGASNVLDTTVPPLFGCGAAGNTLTGTNARGPVPCLQPKGRVIAIEESANGDFKAINDLGSSARVRITFPAGVDINLYGDTAANADDADYNDILGTIFTGGFDSPTFAATVTHVQPISSTSAQAFIDLTIPTIATTTNAITRGVYLVLLPDAIVVPAGTADLNLTIDIVGVGSTDTAITDDTTLATLGTVPLADELSTFLNVSFSPSATSIFETGTLTTLEDFVTPLVTEKYGAQTNTFATPITQVTRFLNSAGPNGGQLWDIVITEGTADALPFGNVEDGVPTSYLNGPAGAADIIVPNDKQIRCVLENPALMNAVNNTAAGHRILFSDSSIKPETATTNDATTIALEEAGFPGALDNGIIIPLATGTISGAPKAASVATSITIADVLYEADGNSTIVTDSDIACWFEVDEDATDGNTDDENAAVVGSTVGLAVGQGGTGSSIEYYPIFTADDAVGELIAARRFNTSPAANRVAFDNADSTARAVFNPTFADSNVIIENAVTYVVDDNSSGVKLLDSATPLTITTGTLPQVNGADDTTGEVAVTVSAAAGTLEPGSIIVLDPSSPTSPDEAVTVPVLDDGSFTAVLRAATDAQITITQSPTTNNSNANIQLRVLNVADAGETPVDPEPGEEAAFDGTVPTLLTSSLVEGQIVVLFDTPATTNFTFADVESTATVNGVAVTKLGDKYAAVVSTTGTYTLAVTVDGETVSTTLDVTTTEKSKKGKIRNLRALKTDKNGRYVLRQRSGKLPNDLDLEIVYSDGTTAVVANADLTRNKKGVVKFDNPESDKTISYVQLLSAKKGSRVAQ